MNLHFSFPKGMKTHLKKYYTITRSTSKMYLKPYQIEDISQPKPINGRMLEADIYNAHLLGDRQIGTDNSGKYYTYLNRPLRQATDSFTGGLHLLHPTIDTGNGGDFIEERPWNGQNRQGEYSQFGPQGWNYNRENIPNNLAAPAYLREHNQSAIDYAIQEMKDKNEDFLRYQNRVHIVSAMDKINAEQGTGALYSPPAEQLRNYIDNRAGPDSAARSDPNDRITPRDGYVDDVIPRDIELFTLPTETKPGPGHYGAPPDRYAHMEPVLGAHKGCTDPHGYARFPQKNAGWKNSILTENIRGNPPRTYENFEFLGGAEANYYIRLSAIFILGFILCYCLFKSRS